MCLSEFFLPYYWTFKRGDVRRVRGSWAGFLPSGAGESEVSIHDYLNPFNRPLRSPGFFFSLFHSSRILLGGDRIKIDRSVKEERAPSDSCTLFGVQQPRRTVSRATKDIWDADFGCFAKRIASWIRRKAKTSATAVYIIASRWSNNPMNRSRGRINSPPPNPNSTMTEASALGSQ